MRVDVDRETEIGRQVAADLASTSRRALSLRMTSQCFCMNSTPGRDRCMGDAVHAVADFGGRVRNALGPQPAG